MMVLFLDSNSNLIIIHDILINQKIFDRLSRTSSPLNGTGVDSSSIFKNGQNSPVQFRSVAFFRPELLVKHVWPKKPKNFMGQKVGYSICRTKQNPDTKDYICF
jgi:hypothetical protein